MSQQSSEKGQISRRYALCVGIGKYPNLPKPYLRYAVDDAKAVANQLEKKGDYIVRCLTKADETTKEVLNRTVEHLLSAPERQKDDLAVLYFACHGFIESGTKSFRLLPSDVALQANDSPDPETSIDISDLTRWLSNARIRHIVILLDVCHSGGAGVALQQLKLNLAVGPNIFIIGGARQDQSAMESSNLEHGLFTNCLLRAFGQPPTKDGWLTISQIQNFVSDEISWFAKDHPIQIQSWSVSVEDLLLLRNPRYPELYPLPPIWSRNVRPRNFFFTEQDEYLSKLFDSLHNEQITLTQPHAISGLGGIGKTQLALEYAYRHRQYYKAVLWGRADTRGSLIETFVNIADLLDLPKDNKNQMIAVKAVKDWLVSHSGWLLILDNAEDLALVSKFLPSAFRGHVLVTTRAHSAGEIACEMKIEEMQPDIGALLLLRRAKRIALEQSLAKASSSEVEIARKLSQEMGGLPLALDQAGAYIESNSWGLQQYYDLYQTRKADLLEIRGGLRKDYPESVATTWNISFEQVKASNRAAVDLLHLCAFLEPDAIPEALITEGAAHLSKDLQRVAADEIKWNKTIKELLRFSLIKREIKQNPKNGRVPEYNTLSIHPLVQEVVRHALPPRESKTWIKRAVLALDSFFSPQVEPSTPNADLAHWETYQRMVPHVWICANWARQASIEPLRAAHLLTKAGSYLQNRGRFAEVEQYYELAYEFQANLRGLPPPLVATNKASSLLNLTSLYLTQGEYEKAEEKLELVKDILVKDIYEQGIDSKLGPAQLWNYFGGLYLCQGRYKDAVTVLHHAIITCEQGLKEAEDISNSSTVTARFIKLVTPFEAVRMTLTALYPSILNNLATVYREQARYKEAEPLYRQSLNIRKELLGPEDLAATNVLHGLATLYRCQGWYEQAEELYSHVLQLRQTSLGESHPDTTTALNDLATLYRYQGKYEQAEELYSHVLQLRQTSLGESHPDTATSLNDLATLYCLQGRYEKAEERYHRALVVRKRRLGSEHPGTAESLHGLATLYCHQGKYEQAESFYQQALAIREREPGTEHPDKADSLNGLATLYCRQGKYDQAEPLYQQALSICKKCLSQDHLLTQKIYKNYVLLLRSMGRDEEA